MFSHIFIFGHQEQVPRKQGLKLECQRVLLIRIQDGRTHQEQVPRKQGLKLHNNTYVVYNSISSRASSTKTRIETQSQLRSHEVL